jgi:hypothetical protein
MATSQTAYGGLESLHQLHYNLLQLGYTSKMVYYPYEKKDCIHPNYLKYKPDVSTNINDSEINVLIVPEVFTFHLYKYKRIRKVIFWLSVDNYYKGMPKETVYLKLKKLFGVYDFFDLKRKKRDDYAIYHLAQSRYALNFLMNEGVSALKVGFITDYIHPTFYSDFDQSEISNKENIVLYNPIKGFEFTKVLIESAPDLKWIPLINMTPEEVKKCLIRGKVYIDFGNHPGKDRFPREATLLSCCIITGLRGSAFYEEDVGIPVNYKFKDDVKEANEIIILIKRIFENYSSHINNFDNYRQILIKEPEYIKNDIRNCFLIS